MSRDIKSTGDDRQHGRRAVLPLRADSHHTRLQRFSTVNRLTTSPHAPPRRHAAAVSTIVPSGSAIRSCHLFHPYTRFHRRREGLPAWCLPSALLPHTPSDPAPLMSNL